MASPENPIQEITLSEKIGYTARNFGVVISAIGLIAPSLLVPGLSLAASGEIMRRVSKNKNESR